MVEKLTDPGRRVWPLVVLDLPAVMGRQPRGGETNRRREHAEVHGGHVPHPMKDPLNTKPLSKRGDGWLTTAEAFRYEREHDRQRGMDLMDAASRPTNRPRKRDIVRAQPVGSRFQARGLLDPRDNPLQVAERSG